MSDFFNFNLDERLLKALEELGYKTPTSIQSLAIPKIASGSDLIVSAQTGTGKTAAFMLPIVNALAKKPSNNTNPSVLILAPTRELAIQITDVAKKFCKYLSQVKTICIYGGVPYPIQKRSLSRPYDILVATPGRLIDHLSQGRINLSKLKLLVLDEADRMLDMGFIDDVEKIAAETPKNRQTLMFSATIDSKILPFSKKLQNNPEEIKIKPNDTAKNNIEQLLYYVDNLDHKKRLLERLLEVPEMQQSIVFTSTKSQASELADHLCDKGFHSSALHGDMNQNQRTRTINKMHSGHIQILVATDVAARGIDIASLSHVINFDLPRNPEDFIHRIGRTGRAEASGIAITFATYREERWISKINRLMGKPLNEQTMDGLEPQSKDKMSKNSRSDFPFNKRQDNKKWRKPQQRFARPGANR